MWDKLRLLLVGKIGGLHKAAYLLGFCTLLSQFLGLVRDRILASTFGASTFLDIYYASFKIPDLVLALGASMASVSVLVPLLTQHVECSVEEGKKFIDEIFSAFSLFIIGISIVLFFLVPYLTSIVFPGFSDPLERQELILLTRILLLSPIILGISNIFASIVQVHNRFLVYALAPILYNIGIIVGIIVFYPFFGLSGLGFGVILGTLLHAAIQIPAVIQEGFLPRLRTIKQWKRIRTVVLTSLPRAFTMSINQIVLIVLVGFASLAFSGAITVFNFAYNLQSVPLSIIGVSYSLAAFPLLSRMIAQRKERDFISRIIYVALHILVLSVPVSALFIVLRTYLVTVLYGVGEFGVQAIRLTATCTALFALSIPAQSLQLLFIRAYYAAGMTKRPLLVTMFGGGLSMLAAYGFTYLFDTFPSLQIALASLFRLDTLVYGKVLLLPLAYSIGINVSVVLLWKIFRADFKNSFPPINQVKATAGLILAGLGVGTITYISLFILRILAHPTNLLITFSQTAVASFIGVIVGYLILVIFGNKPVDEISIAFRKRFSPKGASDEASAPDPAEDIL